MELQCIFGQAKEGGAGAGRKSEKDRESQGRRQRAQLYFLFTQALFETVGRNRGCIHLFFFTSAYPPLLLLYSPSIPYFLSFFPFVSC